MPIPALSAAESVDEVDSVGEEPSVEEEEGLDWPKTVGAAVAEGFVSMAILLKRYLLGVRTCGRGCWRVSSQRCLKSQHTPG